LAGKQAKTLSPAQIKTVLLHLATTRNAERDVVMFLLSVRAGLRACEVAGVTWNMVMDSEGEGYNEAYGSAYPCNALKKYGRHPFSRHEARASSPLSALPTRLSVQSWPAGNTGDTGHRVP